MNRVTSFSGRNFEYTTTYKKPDKKGYWKWGKYILRKKKK